MAGPERQGSPSLRPSLVPLRGDTSRSPDVSVVVPVNAANDLGTVWTLLADLARYRGSHGVEVVLVINNYPEGARPPEVAEFERAGVRTVCVPSAWRANEAVCFSARIPGIQAAASEHVVLFDADCRIPSPTELLDWYADQFLAGADVAYTRVGFYDLRPLLSVRIKVALHHLVRAFKRVALRVPTTRGSNYAVRRSTFLQAYDADLLTDDLNVGPTLKARGSRVRYSGARVLAVLTSGRTFQGGWYRLYRYLRYRFMYNVRLLPVRTKDRRPAYHRTNLRLRP